jgi:hypothetical protein
MVAAVTELEAARRDYERDAPTLADIADAEKAVANARTAMQNDPRSSEKAERYKAAQKHLRDLRAKRSAARAALDAADKRIARRLKMRLGVGGGCGKEQDSSPRDKQLPGTGKAHSPTGKAAPPATHTAAGPAPGVTSPSLSRASNPAAADAIKALIAAQKQPGQPVAFLPQQQPGAVTSSPAVARRGDDKDRALNARDLGLDGTPAVVPMTVPATAIPSPAATKMSAPTPATSGTSVNNLHTTTDVSGRSDAPHVRLSAGTATNATGTEAGTNPVADRSMSPGMAPPFMGAPSNGGLRGKSDKKIMQHNAEEAELQGINTIGEAVRGGTILQRRDDGTGS